MAQQTVYVLSGIVILMCILLSLIAGKKKKVKNIELSVTETEFSVSDEIVLPDTIKGIYRKKEIEFTDIRWVSDDYKNEVGEYIFKPVAPEGYLFEDISVKVKVTDVQSEDVITGAEEADEEECSD